MKISVHTGHSRFTYTVIHGHEVYFIGKKHMQAVNKIDVSQINYSNMKIKKFLVFKVFISPMG